MGNIPGLSVTVGWTEDVAGVTEGIAWEMFNSTDKDMEVNIRCRPNPSPVRVTAEPVVSNPVRRGLRLRCPLEGHVRLRNRCGRAPTRPDRPLRKRAKGAYLRRRSIG
jgi:hypothetical protein